MRMRLAFAVSALLLVVAIFSCACSRLPTRTDVPLDLALPAATGTELDTLLSPVDAAHPGESGFKLIGDGVEAFALLGFSARWAGRSLDLQYYLWHDDLTGKLLAREVLGAADRGVHVRILLDDMDARARNSTLAALDAHPNIEIRLFNPFGSRSGALSKTIELGAGASRLNRRMHNKAWIADNRIAVAGGRNVGDAYFGASDSVNFLDTDLAIIGPAVRQLSTSFDKYWNSAAVWTIASLSPELVSKQSLEQLRARIASLDEEARQSAWVQALAGTDAVRRIRTHDQEFHWTRRWQVLSDDPLKALGDDGKPQRSEILAGFHERLGKAAEPVTLISPYFVPGKMGTAALVGVAKRGVPVSILTNSLASNDVTAVHTGYSRYRDELLEGGVRLWELKPEGSRSTDGKQPDSKGSMFGSKGASLHSKSAIFGREEIFVGSFNLDPRSTSLNCEQGVFVSDPALASELTALFARATTGAHAWQVDLDERGKVRWRDGRRTEHSDPDASLWRRITAGLLRLLPIESQL